MSGLDGLRVEGTGNLFGDEGRGITSVEERLGPQTNGSLNEMFRRSQISFLSIYSLLIEKDICERQNVSFFDKSFIYFFLFFVEKTNLDHRTKSRESLCQQILFHKETADLHLKNLLRKGLLHIQAE